MIPFQELQKLSHKELEKELAQTIAARLQLRMQVATRQSTQTAELKKMRKYIAQVRSLQNKTTNKKVLKADKQSENPKSSVTK